MTDDRPLIARTGELFSRDTMHQSAEGLDVLSSQAFTLHERRLLYDDVQLVTLHVDRGVAYLITTAVFGLFFVALSIFIVAMNTKMYLTALPFFILGLPAVIAFFIRMAVGREVVTVHGRRSKAVLRFAGRQKKKARGVYGQICSLVRRAQQAQAPSFESPSPLARGEGAEGG